MFSICSMLCQRAAEPRPQRPTAGASHALWAPSLPSSQRVPSVEKGRYVIIYENSVCAARAFFLKNWLRKMLFRGDLGENCDFQNRKLNSHGSNHFVEEVRRTWVIHLKLFRAAHPFLNWSRKRYGEDLAGNCDFRASKPRSQTSKTFIVYKYTFAKSVRLVLQIDGI